MKPAKLISVTFIMSPKFLSGTSAWWGAGNGLGLANARGTPFGPASHRGTS